MMSSMLFRTSTRLILPLALVFAAFMFLKGHNAPGGGFIGGLTASVSLMLFAMAHGRQALIDLIPCHPRLLIFIGLIIAMVTGLLPLLWGRAMLTSVVTDLYLGFGHKIHFASAFFFDVGVFLVVIGVSTGMIQRLGEELPA